MASNEDLFVALTECHFMNPQTMSEIAYYPQMKRWSDSVDGVLRAWAGRDLASEWPHPLAAELIGYMDEARVDVCFCLREPMMDISGGTASMSTNGFMLQQIEPYPGRMYPRGQLRAGDPPRTRARDLGARVPGQGARRQALQDVPARGRRSDQRPSPVAVLREGRGARRAAHGAHRQFLRGAAAGLALRRAPARRRDARLPRT